MRAMIAYSWPGNVRELRNVIERALLLSGHADRLSAADLRFDAGDSSDREGADPDRVLTLEEVERRHVERVVELEQGAIDRAAARLGISRSTLYQKLKRHREAIG
jgi:transcriptional regulator with PAS, ATPase and Fis domain